MSSSYRRWLTGKYAISWQLALALLLNYPITGFFFGETEIATTSFTNHFVDLITGLSCAAVVLLSSQVRKYANANSMLFVQITYVVSSIVSISISNFVQVAVGFKPEDISVIAVGVFQMFMVHNVYAVVISSLMETRADRKYLETQRAIFLATQSNLENQINEISARLSNVVNQNLGKILDQLQKAISKNQKSEPKVLAAQVAETLNEGVRPLSWNIENENTEFATDKPIKTKRIGLIERLKFPIKLERVVAIRILILFYLFFDIPVMFFYFGFNAAIQTIFTIGFTALLLWGLKTFTGNRKIASWLAITVISLVVALSSSAFIVYRQLSGELSGDVSEIALVLSMVQIVVINAIFQAALVRRLAYIDDQRQVNTQLEQLVSRLRQSAWVAKKKLARLVHGQVQSELFAAYLQLSQATKPDPVLYKEVSDRIQKAKGALTQTEQAGQVFESVLEQIIATWGSSFKVHTDIASSAMAALRIDPIASACAIEVIREGVNNAAKYGTSGSASLAIKLRDDSRLYIEVLNQAESSDEIIAGYGSEILDDVTHEWNLEITDGVATLTAEIILGQN